MGISAITPFALSFIVVFSWLLWAEGSAAKLQTTIDGLLMAVGIRTPEAEAQHFLQKVTWGEWQRAIFGNALKTMTLPFLIVCAGGVVPTDFLRRVGVGVNTHHGVS